MSSLDSLRDDVASNLSAALDIGKIMNVFNTFVGIIKDQQVKLDKTDEEIRDLKYKMSKLNVEHLESLESKLDEFIQEIKGGGDMDKSILHADISPFDAFHPVNPVIVPIIEDEEEDDSTIESHPARLPRLEEENSITSIEKDSTQDANVIQEKGDDSNDFILEDSAPTPSLAIPKRDGTPTVEDIHKTIKPQVQQNANENSLALENPNSSVVPPTDSEERQSSSSAVFTPLTGNMSFGSPTKSNLPDESPLLSRVPSSEEAISQTSSARPSSERPTSARSNRAASVDTGAMARSARSYSIVVHSEQRPTDGETPILDEISSTLPLVIEALKRSTNAGPLSGRSVTMIRPLSASASATVSGSGIPIPNGRPPSVVPSRPLSGLNSGRKHNSVIVRRRMDANRLEWLTPFRAKRFLKALRMRGRFILISRRIMEESRKKYGAASLKNRIDVLEADLIRINGRMEAMKDTMKKNHAAVKELVSPDVNKLLEVMEKFVKGVNNGMGSMENFLRIVLTLKDANLSALTEMDSDQMSTEKVQQSVVKDIKEQLDAKLAILSKEYVSRQEVMNMLRQGSAVDQNIDQMHLKLLQLIDRTVKPPLENLDFLRLEGEKRVQEKILARQNELINSLETQQIDTQQDMEERLRALAQQVSFLAKRADSNDRIDDEFAVLKTKLKKLEDDREVLAEARGKEAQQRQAEHEALKILQRRLANISVDKLMDELKDVREEIKDRPSTHQVEHMVGKIEKTFKSHLGENVNGLTSLVGQVYKYLQTKVDREDIRNLITSKLMQMEQELIYREEEMFTAAGTAMNASRCISCGQLPAVSRPRTTQQHSGLASPQTGKLMDDGIVSNDASPLVSPSLHNNNSAFSMQGSEQVYSLLTGQVGLRPLHLQHPPLQARDSLAPNSSSSASNSLHNSRPHTMSTNRVKPATAEKIPEPMYRKARMAAQIKEMVKVSNPALDPYGYRGETNPFYVTDTPSSLQQSSLNTGYSGGKLFPSADPQPSLTTLHNTFGGQGNAYSHHSSGGNVGLRSTGAHIVGSQSMGTLSAISNGLDQSHSVSSHGSKGDTAARRVSAVNIDSNNLTDVGRFTAF